MFKNCVIGEDPHNGFRALLDGTKNWKWFWQKAKNWKVCASVSENESSIQTMSEKPSQNCKKSQFSRAKKKGRENVRKNYQQSWEKEHNCWEHIL